MIGFFRSVLFLSELARAYPDDYILLVVDNVAWHHAKALRIPDSIELFPLLPYPPELNPIEMIWDELREKGFRNEIFASLDKVVDRLCEVVVELANDTNRVASITYRQWLDMALMFWIGISYDMRRAINPLGAAALIAHFQGIAMQIYGR